MRIAYNAIWSSILSISANNASIAENIGLH